MNSFVMYFVQQARNECTSLIIYFNLVFRHDILVYVYSSLMFILEYVWTVWHPDVTKN